MKFMLNTFVVFVLVFLTGCEHRQINDKTKPYFKTFYTILQENRTQACELLAFQHEREECLQLDSPPFDEYLQELEKFKEENGQDGVDKAD